MGWSLGDRLAHFDILTGFRGGSAAGAGTGISVGSSASVDSGVGEGEGGMTLVIVSFGTNSSSCPSVGTAPCVSTTAKSPGLSSSTK